jgi:hypothetical protein
MFFRRINQLTADATAAKLRVDSDHSQTTHQCTRSDLRDALTRRDRKSQRSPISSGDKAVARREPKSGELLEKFRAGQRHLRKCIAPQQRQLSKITRLNGIDRNIHGNNKDISENPQGG